MVRITRGEIIRTRLLGLMRLKGVKYGMLGLIIDRTAQTVSKRMQYPETFTVDELIKIAKYFRIDLAELVGGWTHDRNTNDPIRLH